MSREENIRQVVFNLEKQNELHSFIRSDINKVILNFIKKNSTERQGFLGSLLHSFPKEQQDELIGFYKAVNLTSHNNLPLCDRTFLKLCREKMNDAVIPGELKIALCTALKASETALAMRDKLLLLMAGVSGGYLGSQSPIFTVFILCVLSVLYKDVAKMGMVFDFVCKMGDRLDSLANHIAQQQAPAIGTAK